MCKHKPVSRVHGLKNNLIDSFLVGNIPLNGLRAFEDLSYDETVAGTDE